MEGHIEAAAQEEVIRMKYCHLKRKSGQALVEVMIGIVAIMVLVSAILQIALMTKAHTDVMVKARAKAGSLAMTDLAPGMNLISNPDFIRDWDEGNDGRRLSKDDEFFTGDVDSFQGTIVNSSVHDPSGWYVIDSAPDNRVSLLHSDPMVVNSLGLVRGTASETLSLSLPAFRQLIYKADSIELEANAWMTLCKGVY